MNTEIKLLKLTKFKKRRIKIKNYDINYVEKGSSGDPIIFIHGANIGWGQWYKNLNFFSKHFRVFAIDLPGAGNSSKIDFENANFEKDYVEIISEFIRLNKLKNVILIGHSLGGWVSCKASQNNKLIKKIILVNTVGLTTSVPLKYKLAGIDIFAKILSNKILFPSIKNLSEFLAGAYFDKNKLDKNLLNYYYEGINENPKLHPLLLINKISGFFKVRDKFILKNKLLQSLPKTLLICGKHDPLINKDEIENKIKEFKNCQIIYIEDSSHVPFLEKYEEFNTIVLEFIKN